MEPSIALDASGNFVVVWAVEEGIEYPLDRRIFGQRYDGAGAPLGSQFLVSPPRVRPHDGDPSVASDPIGNFVVVWDSGSAPGYYLGSHIVGQRYDSDGAPLGGDFNVTTQSDLWTAPSVASDASGNFVVVWSQDSWYQTGHTSQVFGQRYDSAGAKRGGQFRVNSYGGTFQGYPSVASDAVGNFVVAWHGDGLGSGGEVWGIFGRRFDSSGVAQGIEFRINSYTTDTQDHSSVTVTGTDAFVVVWTSKRGQDGSGDGVFGQRYDFGGDTITVVSPNSNVKWRIGSVQKVMWTHNLGAAATFRIELDRDDDGTFEELIAAAAPVDSATKGSFGWSVTGPPSGTARVRVSWTDDLSVSDSSDVTFQIRPAGLD